MTIDENTLKNLGFTRVQEAFGITEYTFDRNGLKVLLSPDNSKAVVTYMAVYHVGSRNEGVGYTGATHFLEHMKFKGTPKHNPQDGNGVFETIKPLGNMLNATTSYDRTNYFECVGSEHLGVCIELEADRMRNLRLRQEDRDSEMTVVRNEMERSENNIDSVMFKRLFATMFREHPYHHPVLGWRSDVEGVPLERLKQFYDDFYWPNNCTVMVRGDFDTLEALGLIAKYYGDLCKSPRPIPTMYTVEPPQEGEQRFTLERPGDLPRIMIGYHVPEARHVDNTVFEVIEAILGDSGKKSSRVYKHLVDKGLALSASAGHYQMLDPGAFYITSTATSTDGTAALEAAILAEVERLKTEMVTDEELQAVRKSNRKSSVLQMLDPMSWANVIAAGESVADWRWGLEHDDRFDAVSAEDIMRVARQYFTRTNRTVGCFLPVVAQAEPAPAPVEPTAAPVKTTRANYASTVTTRTLSNGVQVLVRPDLGSGAVSLSGSMRSGDCLGGALALLPELAASMLTRGTTVHSKQEVADILGDMGSAARLNFSTDTFRTKFNATVVKDDFGPFLSLVAEMLQKPLYAQTELDALLKQYDGFLRRNAADSERMAQNALMQALYTPESPYWSKPYPEMMTELSVITPDHLRAFHSKYFTPQGLIISVVGDIETEAAFELVESLFGGWTGGPAADYKVPALALPTERKRVDVFLPGKKNADIIIGVPCALGTNSTDYRAARIGVTALGGDTIGSRLGKVVRVKHGLTYGINSYFDDTTFDGGAWVVKLTVAPENIDKALGLVDEVVTEFLRDGITDGELVAQAGENAEGWIVGLRSNAAVAQTLAYRAFLGLDVAGMDTVSAEYRAVTVEQVNSASREYMRLDKAVTVVCGTF